MVNKPWIPRVLLAHMLVNYYFWRTYDQQEIDWVEEREGGSRNTTIKGGLEFEK